MTDKTAAMNSPEAKAKRQLTIEKQKAKDEAEKTLMTIAQQVPSEWAEQDEQKLSLVKSVYHDVLGTFVEKTRDETGKEVEVVKARPIQDLRYFLFKAAQRKLNPFLGQIHAVYIWDSTAKAEKLVTITGIDGFAALAQRTGQYAGLGETEFEFYDDNHPEYPGLPKCAKVDIYKYNPITGAREAVFRATAWWDEYAKYKEKWDWATDEGGNKLKDANGKWYKVNTGERELNAVWKNRPKGQLEKCAQALAFRRAFPEETSGLYVMQEVDRLRDKPDVIDVTPEAQEPKKSNRDKINEALKRRKEEGKSVRNGDVPKEPKPATKAFDDEELKTTPEEQRVLDEEAEAIKNSPANPKFAEAEDLIDDDIGDK